MKARRRSSGVGLADRIVMETRALRAMARAGAIGIERPDRLVRMTTALRRYGPAGGGARIAAIRHGERPAIRDERGEISFAELDEQIDRLANALRGRMAPGSNLAILCRNHRGPLLASLAGSRAGLNVIWMNTSFSPRQCQEVAEREGVDLLIHDADLADLVADVAPPKGRIATDIAAPEDELDRFLGAGDPAPPPAPGYPGRVVLLTSGTTGTPKGAPRPEPRSLALPGGVLERVPLRGHETTVVAPPLFHGTGLGAALLALMLGCRIVLRRSFDPATLLEDSERYGATSWYVVPTMLQRVLALGEEEIARHDLSSLRVVVSGGSALSAELAQRASTALGEVIYNGYGSTEVSLVSFATPADIRAAPTSVGRPLLGVRVGLYDDGGRAVEDGARGRIFVGTTSPFEGYTGGGEKEAIDGLIATGDVGHFDGAGRLYVDGRDDEMIVSGGENVFPREIEELLVTHEAIADAAAIGVEDPEFGQRLCAFVVLARGRQIDADEVKAFVRENLARYKAPREVHFVDELPRNPTGKVLKRELSARLAEEEP